MTNQGDGDRERAREELEQKDPSQPVAPRPRREEQRNRHDSKKIHQTEKSLGGQCRRLTHDLGIPAQAGGVACTIAPALGVIDAPSGQRKESTGAHPVGSLVSRSE